MQLTFGFEIETVFIIDSEATGTPTAAYNTPHPDEGFHEPPSPASFYPQPCEWAETAATNSDSAIEMAVAIASRALRGTGPEVTRATGKAKGDYTHWTLTHDDSIVPTPTTPPRHQKPAPSAHGLELVSPPYSTSRLPTALRHARRILNTLTTPTTSLALNAQCGFHVHVGQPSGLPFPLRTIRYLAWLVLIFEEAIDTLHAPSRRTTTYPGAPLPYNSSVRTRWAAEAAPAPLIRETYDPESGTTERTEVECAYEPLEEIRRDIFGSVGGNEREELYMLVRRFLARRSSTVNFTNLVDGGRARTVEFRQHAGTLDSTEMGWWVLFCAGLVRLAGELAGARAGDWRVRMVGGVRGWDDVLELGVGDLFDLMGFEEGGRRFYGGRVVGYGGAAPTLVWRVWLPFDEEVGVEGVEES